MSNDVLPSDEAVEAIQQQQRQQQLRRDQIDEQTIQVMLTEIEDIRTTDPKTARALSVIMHIFTGDDRFDPDSNA
jgi:hypothetical protein